MGLKAKPSKPVTEVLRPVVAKYGLHLNELVARLVSDRPPLPPTTVPWEKLSACWLGSWLLILHKAPLCHGPQLPAMPALGRGAVSPLLPHFAYC